MWGRDVVQERWDRVVRKTREGEKWGRGERGEGREKREAVFTWPASVPVRVLFCPVRGGVGEEAAQGEVCVGG